jgi:hypothetical protein
VLEDKSFSTGTTRDRHRRLFAVELNFDPPEGGADWWRHPHENKALVGAVVASCWTTGSISHHPA